MLQLHFCLLIYPKTCIETIKTKRKPKYKRYRIPIDGFSVIQDTATPYQDVIDQFAAKHRCGKMSGSSGPKNDAKVFYLETDENEEHGVQVKYDRESHHGKCYVGEEATANYFEKMIHVLEDTANAIVDRAVHENEVADMVGNNTTIEYHIAPDMIPKTPLSCDELTAIIRNLLKQKQELEAKLARMSNNE